jgi:uncharacterized protein YkwD
MKFTLSSLLVAALVGVAAADHEYEYEWKGNGEHGAKDFVKAVNKDCTTFQFYKAEHTYAPTTSSTTTSTYTYVAPTTTHVKPVTTYHPKPKPATTYKPKVETHQAPAPQPTYSGGGGGGSTSGLSSDEKAALDKHNQARSIDGCAPLEWDDSLAASAQSWAQQLTQIGHLQHSQGGQNLYWSSAAGGSPLADGSQAWINEKSLYHGESIPNGNFEAYGHYTQCVWKSTKKVGIAMAKDSKGGVYVVAHYSPAGNMVGQGPF